MALGELILKNVKWEQFADAIAKGKTRADAYMQVYGMKERRVAQSAACRMFKSKAIIDRIAFLSCGKIKYSLPRLSKSGKSNDVNLQSVIKTCQEVIETSESTPQKLKAIEVLNKLGVFDGETKGDKGRMDPASICAWLAQFAGAPAEHLAKMPGGLKGMLKGLMELTGTMPDQLIEVLKTMGSVPARDVEPSKASEIPMLAGSESHVATGEIVESGTGAQRADLLDFEKEERNGLIEQVENHIAEEGEKVEF